MNKIVVISHCFTYEEEKIYRILLKHFEQLQVSTGKLNNRTVLLKPNLLGPHRPEESVTTHPVFLQVVIKICKSFDCKRIIVADSPSVLNFDEVVTKTGIKKVCIEGNVELVNLSTYPVVEINFNKFGLRKLAVSKIVNEVDFIINLPKLKTHSLTIYTCAVKNMYGVVPGMTKSLYHRYAPHPKEFVEILYTIYNYRKPDLTIVDGIFGMDGEGPASGNVKNFGLILSSTDGFSVDWYVKEKVFKVGYSKIYNKSLTPAKIVDIDVVLKSKQPTIDLPKTTLVITYFPSWILNLLKTFVWFRPKINQDVCKKCGKCYDICPQKTIKVVNNNYIVFYSKCISCFCCVETCPYKAIKIEYSPLYKLVLLLKNFVKKLLG